MSSFDSCLHFLPDYSNSFLSSLPVSSQLSSNHSLHTRACDFSHSQNWPRQCTPGPVSLYWLDGFHILIFSKFGGLLRWSQAAVSWELWPWFHTPKMLWVSSHTCLPQHSSFSLTMLSLSLFTSSSFSFFVVIAEDKGMRGILEGINERHWQPGAQFAGALSLWSCSPWSSFVKRFLFHVLWVVFSGLYYVGLWASNSSANISLNYSRILLIWCASALGGFKLTLAA